MLLNKKRKPKRASVFAKANTERNTVQSHPTLKGTYGNTITITSWIDFNKTKQSLDNFTDSGAGQRTLIILYPRRKGEGRSTTLRHMVFHLLHWV